MNAADNSVIRRGTENVFADLGFADADTHVLKAELVARLQDVARDRKPNQVAVARLAGVSQPDISRLFKGQYRDISVERIMKMLTKLGCDVDIVVKPLDRKQSFEAIRLAAVPVS